MGANKFDLLRAKTKSFWQIPGKRSKDKLVQILFSLSPCQQTHSGQKFPEKKASQKESMDW